MRRLSLTQIKWLKVVIHLAAFLPFIWLLLSINQGWFSADPAKDIQHFTGRMTLKLLLATLLITPVARYGKQPLLIRVRRLVGLWCFAWGTLHLLSYAFLELGINNLGLLGSELISRPYLTLGIISWIILLRCPVLQLCGHNANWAASGKRCITLSMLSPSWHLFTICGQSKSCRHNPSSMP